MGNRIIWALIIVVGAIALNQSCRVSQAQQGLEVCACDPAPVEWQPLDLRNGWTGIDAAFACDPSGFVHFRGLIWREESNPADIAFVLPDSCTPAHFAAFPAVSHLPHDPDAAYIWIQNGVANVGPAFATLYGLSAPLD